MRKSLNDRKIVFINQSTGYLTIDIINAFYDSGEFTNIAIIAGSIRVQDIPLNEKVKWSKIVLYNRGTFIKKFFSWLIGTIQIFFLLVTKYRKYEIFFISIPPLAYLSTFILRRKYSILIYDLYPDALAIYGMKNSHLIYKLWSYLNKRVFPKAHKIYTISDGLKDEIYKYSNKISAIVIPNWTGLTKLSIVPKAKNDWLSGKPFKDKFIVLYSGNIGSTHNVETIVEIANRLKTNEDIHFVIIGRGDRKVKIKKMIEKQGLTNCTLLPYQPDEQLKYSLSASDLSVVVLDSKVSKVSLPSKIYNLHAVGSAILGICSSTSELYKHIDKNKVGKAFAENQLEEMVDFIKLLNLNSEKLEQYKSNSYAISEKYTYRNANNFIQSYLE